MRVIAIDGPAGSGKSTVARLVADRLGLEYLDTGAMYRGVAFAALRGGVDPADADDVAELARSSRSTSVRRRVRRRGRRHDRDPGARGHPGGEHRRRQPRACGPSSRRQREWVAEHDGGVVEGRDIGTVVFPDAELKVFLTASRGPGRPPGDRGDRPRLRDGRRRPGPPRRARRGPGDGAARGRRRRRRDRHHRHSRSTRSWPPCSDTSMDLTSNLRPSTRPSTPPSTRPSTRPRYRHRHCTMCDRRPGARWSCTRSCGGRWSSSAGRTGG